MCRIDGTRDVCMRVASVCLIYTKLDSGYALFECSLKIYSRLESSNLFFFSEKCSASNVSVGARARVCGVFFISHMRQIELTWRQWCIAIRFALQFKSKRKFNSVNGMENTQHTFYEWLRMQMGVWCTHLKIKLFERLPPSMASYFLASIG